VDPRERYGELKSLLAAYRGSPTELSSADYLLASGAAGTYAISFMSCLQVIAQSIAQAPDYITANVNIHIFPTS